MVKEGHTSPGVCRWHLRQ